MEPFLVVVICSCLKAKRGVRKILAWTNTLAYMPPIRQMRYDQEEPTPASLENTCQRRRIIEKLTWGQRKTRIARECPQGRGPERGKEDGDETIKARETGEREREERLRKGECASWVWQECGGPLLGEVLTVDFSARRNFFKSFPCFPTVTPYCFPSDLTFPHRSSLARSPTFIEMACL